MYFDIGANVGHWTLANIDSCQKIIAVEASPITFNTLSNNCRNPKITLLNYAVCDNNGNDITFYHAKEHTLSTLNKDWLTEQKSRFNNMEYTEIICKTITIDKLISEYGVPTLIKVDVEGGEYECIKSLTQRVDTLCFEWACEFNEISYKCLDHLRLLGFNRFYIQFKDDYTYRPNINDCISLDDIKHQLSLASGDDWGMMWCIST